MAVNTVQETAMARQQRPAVFHTGIAFDRRFCQITGLGEQRDKTRPSRQDAATHPLDRAPKTAPNKAAAPTPPSNPAQVLLTDPRHQARSADQAAEHIAAYIH